MSLDVYLTGKPEEVECECERCGHVHTRTDTPYLYNANITHNLGRMAEEAGIYEELWRPEEIGITKAHQLIQPLTDGLTLLKGDPARFQAFDAPNGWGLYVHFVPWVERYLEACKEFPEADVHVSR